MEDHDFEDGGGPLKILSLTAGGSRIMSLGNVDLDSSCCEHLIKHLCFLYECYFINIIDKG